MRFKRRSARKSDKALVAINVNIVAVLDMADSFPRKVFDNEEEN